MFFGLTCMLKIKITSLTLKGHWSNWPIGFFIHSSHSKQRIEKRDSNKAKILAANHQTSLWKKNSLNTGGLGVEGIKF